MSAVVGVLNESLTESVKGFYKLRKAYMTLDAIVQAEARYMKRRTGGSLGSTRSNSVESLRSNRSARSMKAMPGSFGDETTEDIAPPRQPTRTLVDPITNQVKAVDDTASQTENQGEGDQEEDEFFDADEDHQGSVTSANYPGHGDVDGMTEQISDLSIQPNGKPLEATRPISQNQFTTARPLYQSLGSEVFANPIDTFIHSGSNLCFGLLLLMISLIPPAWGKLLFIIGFRGDRERGLKMLWQASKIQNINGAMAGLVLLGYYNGLVQFCEIIPDDKDGEDNVEGFPKRRCEILLAEMRCRYPRSHLWLLEEARMAAANKRLDDAIRLLSADTKSQLKQVEALSMFEKSLNAMYSHRYELCAESFLEVSLPPAPSPEGIHNANRNPSPLRVQCLKLNSWSHALYLYIAGCAHIALYRQHKHTSPATARTHATKATTYLRQVPQHTGKKRIMARQLPFDAFVGRKLAKWESRARDWHVDLVDAVGVDPIEEMTYFWNGHQRMSDAQLTTSLAALAWSEDPAANPLWRREALDERAILAVLRAAVLRNLRRFADAKAVLVEVVLGRERAEFKGQLRDDWTCPVAHYEMGAVCWMQRDGGAGDAERVRECGEWLEKVARWESFGLDARIGLKVTMGLDTLKKYGGGGGGAVQAG